MMKRLAIVERLKTCRSSVLVLTASAIAAPLIVMLCAVGASSDRFAPTPPSEIASAPVA